jgi:hypothetical protein
MQNQEFYFSTGVFISNFMCLADSGRQTTVVIAGTHTVPKRSIPYRVEAISVVPGSSLLPIVPEWE